jgi:hypothetical protein
MKKSDQFEAMAAGSIENRIVVVFYDDANEQFVGFSPQFLAHHGVPVNQDTDEELIYNSTQFVQ